MKKGLTEADLRRKKLDAALSFFSINETNKSLLIASAPTGSIPFDLMPPNKYDISGKTSHPFRFYWMPYQNPDGTWNNVMKYGFNVDGQTQGQSGLWFAMEPWWILGGLPHIETHLQYHHPTNNHIRLLSSTVQERATVAETTNYWDFRGTTFNFQDLQNNSAFTVSKLNGPRQQTEAKIIGSQPVFTFQDDLSGTSAKMVYASGQLFLNKVLTLTGQVNGANMFVQNVGGVKGGARIDFLSNSGKAVRVGYNGSANGNFYIVDEATSKTLFTSLPITGNVVINAAKLTDEGSAFQVRKNGTKGIYTDGDIRQEASAYHNFGATAGSGGYGIRDNAGVMEVKHNGGAWASLSAIPKDAFTSAVGTSRPVAADTIIEKILIKPATSLVGLRIGTTAGADNIMIEQAVPSGVWKVFNVEENGYYETAGDVFFTGITSSTQIKIIKTPL